MINRRSRHRTSALLTLAVAPAAMFLAAHPLRADDTWLGAGADANWQTAANWDVLPVAGDSLLFAGSAVTTTNNNFTAGTAFGDITFDTSATTSFLLNGNAVTLNGDITNNSTIAHAISLPITLAAEQHTFSNVGTGGLTLGLLTAYTPGSVAGGTVIFAPSTGIITTANATTNGILGGWATLGGNWATVDATGKVLAYTNYTTLASTTISSNATTNVQVTSAVAGNLTLGSSLTDINTFLDNETGARVIDVGAGKTLRLGTTGGIFRNSTSSTSALTIGKAGTSAGFLTAGGPVANTPGELVLNSNASASGTTFATGMIVNSVITDNGSGAVTVVATNIGSIAGTILLNNANTYSGGTFINAGIVQLGNAGALGTGTVTLGGGAFGELDVNANNAVLGGLAGTFGSLLTDNSTTAGFTTLTVNNNHGSTTFAGTISDGINRDITLVIGGTGSLALTGFNTYSGGTIINSGTLQINSLDSLGSSGGAITLGGGKLEILANSGALVETSTVQITSSTSSIQVDSGSSYNLSGGVIVAAGVNFTASGNLTLTNATLNTDGNTVIGKTSETLTSLSGIGSLAMNGTLTITSGGIFSGILKNGTSNATLVVSGGTLVLSGNNTYIGGTTINSGATLQVGAGSTTGTWGNLNNASITNNGTLIFNRSDNINITQGIAGTGTLQQIGTGILTLSANNSFSGTATVQNGTLKATATGGLGTITTVNISNGGTFDINGLNWGALTFNIAGQGVGGLGAIQNSGGNQTSALSKVNLTADASIGGNGGRFDLRPSTPVLTLNGFTLTKVGTNQFSLVGTTVTAGNIVVNGGVFSMETSSNITTSGLITFNANTTCQFFANTGLITRPILFAGDNILIGNASGTGTTIAAPVTLSGNVTFTSLNSGVLSATSNNPLTWSGNIVESGGSHSIAKSSVNTLTLTGSANSWSGLTNIIAGNLTFAPNGTNTGNSSIGAVTAAGNLAVNANANVTSDGIVATGNVTVSGKLTIRPNGTATGASKLASLTIAGTNGAWTGTVDIANNAIALQTSGAADKAAKVVTTIDQINSGHNGGNWLGTGITSQTAAGNTSNLAVGLFDNATLNLATLKTGGPAIDSSSLIVGQTFIGDANFDGKVDISDLTVIANHWQSNQTTWDAGDLDFSGFVDINDLTAVANHWQLGAGPGFTGQSFASALAEFSPFSNLATPEPASLAVVTLAAPLLLRRRRNRA